MNGSTVEISLLVTLGRFTAGLELILGQAI